MNPTDPQPLTLDDLFREAEKSLTTLSSALDRHKDDRRYKVNQCLHIIWKLQDASGRG